MKFMGSLTPQSRSLAGATNGLLHVAGAAAFLAAVGLLLPWLSPHVTGGAEMIPLPLKYAAAVALALAGVGAIALALRQGELSRGLAILAASAALLGLWQTIALWPGGSGLEIAQSSFLFATPSPELASIGMLACLVLISAGLGLFSVGHSWARAASALVAAVAAAAALTGVLGFAFDSGLPHFQQAFGPLVSSAALFLLAAAVIWKALYEERLMANEWPTWLAMPAVAASFTLAACLAVALRARERADILYRSRNAAILVAGVIEDQIRDDLDQLTDLAAAWSLVPADTAQASAVKVRPFLDGCTQLIGLSSEGMPLWSAPPEPHLPHQAALMQALSQPHPTCIPTSSGSYWMIVPADPPSPGLAALAALYESPRWFERRLDSLQLREYAVELWQDNMLLYRGEIAPKPSTDAWVRERRLDNAPSGWLLRVWPTPAAIQQRLTMLPWAFLGFGTLLSVLLGLAIRLAQQARQRARLLADIKAGLEQEIVQRLQAERSQRRLLRIVEATPDFVTIATPDGRVVAMNSACRRFFGLGENDPLGLRRIETGYLPDSAGRLLGEAMTQARAQGSWSGELQLQARPDAPPADLLVLVLAHHNRQGEVEFYSTIARDIREIKAAQEEQRRLLDQLGHARRLESLGVLAGGIAHDFNNLLAGILGNLEIASRSMPPGTPAQAAMASARSAGQRAAELTRQMLAFSGKGQFAAEAVSLNRLVRELVSQHEPNLTPSVNLVLDLAQDVPEISADPEQIRQLVHHLFVNAAEACGEGPGTITVRTRLVTVVEPQGSRHPDPEEIPPGRYALLEVADDGPGMDEATRQRIFEPFFTTKFVGRGLGLAAVDGIVRGHRGAIKVVTAPGQGACFRVFLPLRHESPTPTPTSISTSPAMPSPAPEEPDSAPRSKPPSPRGGLCLVADDEEIVLELIAQVLEGAGYQVLRAADGEEAEKIFEAHRDQIACAVLDQTMPKRTGHEVFLSLVQQKPGLPVIITSGYDEAEIARSFRDGQRPAAFLGKPFSAADLVAKVRAAIGQK